MAINKTTLFWKFVICFSTMDHIINHGVFVNCIPPTGGLSHSDLLDDRHDHFGGVIPTARTTDFLLQVNETSLERLAEIITDDIVTVYMKLHFTNINWEDPYLAYFEEQEFFKYIDPLTFTFTRPGLGYLLLSLPFDFIPLSLFGLNYAVSNVDINIEVSYPDYFLNNYNDSEQLGLVFDLLESTIRDADDINRGRGPFSLGEFSICLDHLDNRKGVYAYVRNVISALLNNRYPLMQSIHDCRTYDADVDSEGPPEQYWLNKNLPLIFSFCIFVFAPLAFAVVVRMNPPFKDKHGTLKMTSTCDLPLGLKYSLLHSYGHKKIMKVGRVMIGLLLLIFFSYFQPMIAYLANRDDFLRRVYALQRFDQTSYWIYIGTALGYYAFLLAIFLAYVFQIVLPDKDGMCWESEDTRRYLSGMTLPKELWVPPANLPFIQSALFYAKFRMTMALDIRVLTYEYQRLWNWITSGADCRWLGKYILCVIGYILLVLPYTILLMLRLIINSVPAFYIMKQCFWYIRKIPFGAIIIVLAAMRLPAFVWYAIAIFQCVITGFALNPRVVVPPFVIATAIGIFAMRTFERVTDDYSQLTQDIFHQVACLQNWIRGTTASRHAQCNPRSNHTNDTESVANSSNQATQNGEINNQYLHIKNDTPEIEVDLYNFVVNEIQNTQKRFTCTALSLLIASVFLAIGFQFLWYINKEAGIGSIMLLVSSVVIAITLPRIYCLISIDPIYNLKKNDNRRRIRELVIEYYKRESYESIELKARSTEPSAPEMSTHDEAEENTAYMDDEVELNDIYSQPT